MARSVTRTKSVRIRLSEDELANLAAFSREHGLTISEVLRRLAREAAGFGPTYDAETRDAIREYARQLKAIGVNINQIAYILNSGRTPDYPTLHAGIGRLTKELVTQSEDYRSLCAKARKRAQRRIGIHHD
ncbi:plasmid mobilization relaxosome protein MobC [Phyllobacterium sp. P30BS-XVII]|uniref:plasmid mobilization protein n=1 Tax=Phyllobacterium sp. P30BS-XVII TaxID=2587046 RepID=UPI0015F89905|nr:plasmid mobilization relaxosome protein MobC [Phyllobacterium sp. P30BS-XVII]MBA8904127.1 DNA-binding transcriptional MerR regulator [Phyllobacterium sp. P30BS-XVII]